MRHPAFLLLLLPLVLSLPELPAQGEDWPQFRGPGGQGHASARGLPKEWSEDKNIAWKVALPGKRLVVTGYPG